MTDTIIIYDQDKNKKWEYKCSFQSKVYLNWLDIDVEEWDIIERLVTKDIIERLTVTDVGYITWFSNNMNAITLTVEKITKFNENKTKKDLSGLNITIKDSTINWSNISWINSGIQSIQNIDNEIDKVLGMVDESNIPEKEEIRQLLIEAKDEKDENEKHNKLIKVLSIFWNMATIWQVIIAIIWMAK